MVLLDKFMADLASGLAPHYSVPDLSKPFNVSGRLSLLSPTTSILGNYLASPVEDIEKDTISSKLNTVEVEIS
jgi:hypothetical protein